MNKFIEYFLNWWVSRPANIFIDGITVAVDPKHWLELSWVNFLGFTFLPVIVSILICYLITKARGGGFLFRWWIFNLITSVLVAIGITIFMKSKVFVGGTINSPIYWQIPNFMILSRALVGLLQSFLLYIIFSFVISRLFGGAIITIQKFNLNKAYPLPRLFRAD